MNGIPKLARYLTGKKYESWKQQQNIHFARLDLMQDKDEGKTSAVYCNEPLWANIQDADNLEITLSIEMREKFRKQNEKSQKKQFVSCWYVFKEESDQMWKEYSDENGALIIINQGDLSRILIQIFQQLNPYLDKIVDYIHGKIQYLPKRDLEDPFCKLDLWYPYNGMKKKDCYQHEKEYRYLIPVDEEIQEKILSIIIPDSDMKCFVIRKHPSKR